MRMDSHHIGSDVLLYIQTESVALTIKGPAVHPKFPEVELSDKKARISVVCNDDFELVRPVDPETVLLKRLNSVSIGDFQSKPSFFEQQRYEVIIEPAEGHEAAFWHENYNVRKQITPVGRMGSILSGVINFGNEIGFSDLIIRIDGKDYLKLTLEVFPSKISYKDDYQEIIADITSEIYNLIFDFLKKTYESFNLSSGKRSSMAEFFAILRKIFDEFVSASDIILRNPNHQLQVEHEVLPFHKVRRTDAKTARWLEKHPEQIMVTDGRVKAEKALAVKKYVTYDTRENRLAKYMLVSTCQRLERVKKQYCRLDRETDQEIIHIIDKMIQGIQRRCNTGFMKDVDAAAGKSGMSLVFSMAPGYRDLYKNYLLLQRGLSVTGSVFNISIKDMAQLYEYWCFIKLNRLLKDRYELKSQDIIRINGTGLAVSLVKGQGSQVKYRNPRNGEVITLSYNPSEINVPTVAQKPDNVLSLEKKGANTDYEYVFDAKYRINPSLEGTYYHKNIDEKPGPEVSDINTMHRYRDAIVYQNDASPYERTMFGAYVLFPYHNEEEYKAHKFYKSIEQVNIGGLPFLPSATNLVSDMLDELISDSPDSAFERATLPKGIESKLAKVDWSRRDVLVGTIGSQNELDACLDNRFYYFPCDEIREENLPIHYVAMYQTIKQFKSEARIEYYGEVLTTSTVKRSEVTEVPDDSGEMYYRFEIKEWKRLSHPIEPKEFGYRSTLTNMFLLENSEYVPELFLKSEEEYRFYHELKRRTSAVLIDENECESGFEIGPAKVSFDNGEILMMIDGKLYEKRSVDDFIRAPNAMFRVLTKGLKL